MDKPNNTTEMNELTSKANPDKRQRKKRNKQVADDPDQTETSQSMSTHIGLAAELGSLKDDIITITTPRNAAKDSTVIITEANKIPLTVKYGNELVGGLNVKTIENIYIEKHLGFRTEPLTQYERRLAEKQKAMQAATLQRMQLEQTNPGLVFALGVHGVLDSVGRTILGMFAGATFVHTLFVQSFRVSKCVQSSGAILYEKDNGLRFLLRYGLYSEAVAIAYYVVFILTGLFVFGRFDVGRPTNKCLVQCISLANGGLSVIFHVCAFVISNAMQWLNYNIYTSAGAPENELTIVLVSRPELTRWIDVWLIMDICRTVFLVASWLFIAFASQSLDRTRETLYINPINEDRVGPSGAEDVWKSTDTVKTIN